MPALPDQLTLASHALALVLVAGGLLALRRWPYLYAVSIWPGTVAHELLHYIAGLLFGARPLSLSVVPRRKLDGGWLLCHTSAHETDSPVIAGYSPSGTLDGTVMS